MKCARFCLVILVSLFASAESNAQVDLPSGISLYAGGTLDFDSFGTVSGGAVVAGGDVTHGGGILNVDQISGAGGFSAEGAAFQNTFGPFVFNGDILDAGGPGSVFDGPVTSNQGSIDFNDTSTIINGDVTAAGGVEFEFVFGTINGNVRAGGPIDITATVNGTTTSATPTLTPFTLEPLPAGRGLTAGTNDINLESFEDITLAPGTYGTLNFGSSNEVTLTAGSYVFADIVSDFSLNDLIFDTTAGNIDLYIAADDFVLDDLVQVINDVAVFGSRGPNPQLSRDIFIEAAGDLTIGSSFYGTFFAPNGDVTIETFSDITGRVFAGGNVTLENVDILTVGLLGDANLDGAVNFGDIGPFISLLSSNVFLSEADCNQDGAVNFADIASFIEILSGS